MTLRINRSPPSDECASEQPGTDLWADVAALSLRPATRGERVIQKSHSSNPATTRQRALSVRSRCTGIRAAAPERGTARTAGRTRTRSVDKDTKFADRSAGRSLRDPPVRIPPNTGLLQRRLSARALPGPDGGNTAASQHPRQWINGSRRAAATQAGPESDRPDHPRSCPASGGVHCSHGNP